MQAITSVEIIVPKQISFILISLLQKCYFFLFETTSFPNICQSKLCGYFNVLDYQ